MINHARTLILNRNYATRPAMDSFGEEYIPEEYSKRQYPAGVKKLRELILGTDPEPVYENFMLAQIMKTLHSNDVTREYILGLDSRYTYDVESTTMYDYENVSIATPRLNPTVSINLIGESIANELKGIAKYQWTLKTTAANTAYLSDLISGVMSTITLSIVGEKTTNYSLNSGLKFSLDLPGGLWVENQSWGIESIARPTKTIGAIVKLFEANVGVAKTLINSPESFRNMWLNSDNIVERLAGVLGAMVYKMENVNNGR